MRYILLAAVFLLGACEPATLRTGDPDPISPVKGPDQQVGPGGDNPMQPPAPPTDGDGDPTEPDAPPATPQAVLNITAPPRGARVLGNTLRVQGTVQGGTAPVVTVAGQPVPLKADRSFIADVPVTDGLAVLITELTDGNVKSIDHRAALINADQDPANPVPSAADVGINAAGFQVISQIAAQYAATADLSAVLGGNASGDTRVRSLNYSRVDLQLVPVQDAIQLRLAIFDLNIEIEATVNIIFDVDVRGSMRANPAEMTALLKLTPDGQGGLSLQLEDGRAQLQDFGYNINNVPGAVEDWFEDTVRDMAEGLLSDALNDVVVPSLFDPAALNQQLDVMGAKVNLAMAVDQVRIDPTGMHLALSAAALPEVAVYPGKAARPVGGVNVPADPAHLDIALAADFVNRILHAVWAAGVLDMEIGGADGSVDLPVALTAGLLLGALGEAGHGIPPSTPLIIRTRAMLPPYCSLEPGNRPMRISMGDFLLEIATATETLVVMAVHLQIDLGLEADETGALQPKFEMEQHVDVAETPRGKVNEAAMEALIGGILGQFPQLLVDGLTGNAADPMPAGSLSLENMRFVAGGVFLHVLGDIDPTPPAP